MRKIILLFIFLTSICSSLKCQDYLYYTQYLFNSLSINPAYAGSQDFINISGDVRKQWVGIKGAPFTQSISANAPIMKDMFGIGLIVNNDNIGVTNQQEVSLSYSYKIRFTNQSLSFGLKGGVNTLNSRFDQLNLDDQSDKEFQNNENRVLPIFGFGAYLKGSNYFIGISAPQLYKFFSTKNYNKYFNLQKICFITGGYIYQVNENLKIKPSTLVKMNFGSVFEMDFTTTVFLKEKYMFGGSYKTLNSASLFFEVELQPGFFLGYSYDIPTTNLFHSQYGSHEISLNIYIDKKGKTKVMNPRYF
jgi:type IX secretion system PorP/SprF family membrane protein